MVIGQWVDASVPPAPPDPPGLMKRAHAVTFEGPWPVAPDTRLQRAVQPAAGSELDLLRYLARQSWPMTRVRVARLALVASGLHR